MIDTCDHPRKYKVTYFDNRDELPLLHCRPKGTNTFYIITLRIQALSLVESHDLLEDRRTELRHTKHFPIAFLYLYIDHVRVIFVKFQNVWVDKK
jgi:hypothetical protein